MKRKLGNFVMLFIPACISSSLLTSAVLAYGGFPGCGGMSGHAPTGFGGTRGGGNSNSHVVENREKILIELNAMGTALQRAFYVYKDTLPCIKTINQAELSFMLPANRSDVYLSLIKNYSLQIDIDAAAKSLALTEPTEAADKQITISFPTKIGDCAISGNGHLPWKVSTAKGQWSCYSIALSKDVERMLSRRQKQIVPKIQTEISQEFLNELHRKTVAKNADRIALQIPLETKDARITAAELAPHRDQIILSMHPTRTANFDQLLWCVDIDHGKIDADWKDFQESFQRISTNAQSLEWLQQWREAGQDRKVAAIAGYDKKNLDSCYVDQRLKTIWQENSLEATPSCSFILLSRGAQVGIVLSSEASDKVLCLIAKANGKTSPHAISEAEEAADIVGQKQVLVGDKQHMPPEIAQLDAQRIWTESRSWPLRDDMIPLSEK